MRRVLFLVVFAICFCSPAFASYVTNRAYLYSTSNSITTVKPVATKHSPVIITAKRSLSSSERIAENVEVYTREDIDRLPAQDLSEVLKYISGVDTKVNGKFGQASSLSIRGSNSRDVLVMVDGIPFNTQLSGQANPARIPLEHIERIEVIKGASSSAWGSSLGGVVNVITKDVGGSEAPEFHFQSSAGEFETTKNSLSASGKHDQIGYFFAGSFMSTDGPKESTDTEEIKGFGKLSYALTDALNLTGSFGYSGANVHDGITPSNRINSTPYHSRYGKLLLDMDTLSTNMNIAYKYNDQDVTTDIFNATTGNLVSSTVSNNVYHAVSLNSSFELFDDDILVVGGDFEWHKLKSNNFLNEAKEIYMYAPYMNYTLGLGQWDFIGGMRYDSNEQFGIQTSPSLGIIYHVEDERDTLIRAKISRAFNAPPLLWIFNDDSSVFVGPNPDLKAERAIVYEVGLETELVPRLSLEVSAYRSDIKDAIALVFEGGVFVQKNFRKFRRQGGEVMLNYQLLDDLAVYTSAAFNDVENRQTRQLVRDAGITRQHFSFGTKYQNKSGFNLHLIGNYDYWLSTPSNQANDRKFIFDAKLTQDIKALKNDVDLKVFLNAYNLTNSKYWSNISLPLPRRYFEGGLSMSF